MPEEQPIEKQVIVRHAELKAVRDPFVDLWKDCTNVGYPARNDWEDTAGTGRHKEVEVYDDTCIKAVNLRADGIFGYHVSPAIRWFTQRMGSRELQDVDEVKEWLQECDEGMYYAYSRSNFYEDSCIGNFLRDGDAIGLATMFIEEIIGEGKIGFMVPHPREMFVAEDKYGRPVLMHRRFKWTALEIKDALDEKEIKKLSAGLQLDLQRNQRVTTKWEFVWAIWPNPNYIEGSIAKYRRKYITYLVQVDGTNLIRTDGLDRLPPVWRVKKPSNLPYGRGLIGDALVSIQTSNEMAKQMLDAGEYSINPAWTIPDELRGKFDRTPGGENYYKDIGREAKPLYSDIKYPFGAEERKQLQDAVKENFQLDFFMALSRAAMENTKLTATQVIEMMGEKAAMMGAQLGTLNTKLDEIHDGVFDIEMNAGRLPPPPQIVLDAMMKEERETGKIRKAGKVDVDYVGPLAQAQKRLFKTEGIRQSLEALKPLVELQMAAGQPVTALDRLDEDETVQEIFEAHGMPQKLMHTDEEVDEIQQARAEAAQARELAELAAGAAEAVPNLQKKTEEGSPLAEIAGAG